MKTVYLVRHGESSANVGATKYFEGAESPLTEKGTEQARYIAERCTKLPIDLLVASTVKRAQQTASAISERINKPITSSELFVERMTQHPSLAECGMIQKPSGYTRSGMKRLFLRQDDLKMVRILRT